MNKIILIGRLTDDPVLRYSASGVAVTQFTLAVDRPFSSDAVDFIDIVTWRKLAETCAYHLNKGRLVAVEGHLQIRSYDDQNGIRRRASEVVANSVQFLDKAKNNNTADEPKEDYSDDIPF